MQLPREWFKFLDRVDEIPVPFHFLFILCVTWRMARKVARMYVLRQRFFAILTTFEIKKRPFSGVKGTQAWNNYELFFGLNQNLICPWLIFAFVFILFFRFFPEFRCSNIFAVTKHTRNQFFVEKFLNFFCKMFTMVLLDGILDDFSKFRLCIAENCILIWFFRFLFFFIAFAFWSNSETISSLAEHTRNEFHHCLSIRGDHFIAG